VSFAVRTEQVDGGSIVAFTGELEIAVEREATAALEAALGADGVLIADLRDLEFLDSTGVRVLLAADLRAREQGVRFGVARGQGMVRRLLEVTRIDQRFPVVDDPAELMGSGAASDAAQ
jgi:anti-sigma B factor antagonist